MRTTFKIALSSVLVFTLAAAAPELNAQARRSTTTTSTSSSSDTIEEAIAWKATNSYVSKYSKACWPCVKDVAGVVYHLSTLFAREMARNDTLNDGTVTLRFRDTMEQERVSIDQLNGIIEDKVSIASLLKKQQ